MTNSNDSSFRTPDIICQYLREQIESNNLQVLQYYESKVMRCSDECSQNLDSNFKRKREAKAKYSQAQSIMSNHLTDEIKELLSNSAMLGYCPAFQLILQLIENPSGKDYRWLGQLIDNTYILDSHDFMKADYILKCCNDLSKYDSEYTKIGWNSLSIKYYYLAALDDDEFSIKILQKRFDARTDYDYLPVETYYYAYWYEKTGRYKDKIYALKPTEFLGLLIARTEWHNHNNYESYCALRDILFRRNDSKATVDDLFTDQSHDFLFNEVNVEYLEGAFAFLNNDDNPRKDLYDAATIAYVLAKRYLIIDDTNNFSEFFTKAYNIAVNRPVKAWCDNLMSGDRLSKECLKSLSAVLPVAKYHYAIQLMGDDPELAMSLMHENAMDGNQLSINYMRQHSKNHTYLPSEIEQIRNISAFEKRISEESLSTEQIVKLADSGDNSAIMYLNYMIQKQDISVSQQLLYLYNQDYCNKNACLSMGKQFNQQWALSILEEQRIKRAQRLKDNRYRRKDSTYR